MKIKITTLSLLAFLIFDLNAQNPKHPIPISSIDNLNFVLGNIQLMERFKAYNLESAVLIETDTSLYLTFGKQINKFEAGLTYSGDLSQLPYGLADIQILDFSDDFRLFLIKAYSLKDQQNGSFYILTEDLKNDRFVSELYSIGDKKEIVKLFNKSVEKNQRIKDIKGVSLKSRELAIKDGNGKLAIVPFELNEEGIPKPNFSLAKSISAAGKLSGYDWMGIRAFFGRRNKNSFSPKVIRNSDNSIRFYINRTGEMQYNRGNKTGILYDYEVSSNLGVIEEGESPFELLEQGKSAIESRDLISARNSFQKSLRLDNSLGDAYYFLANTYGDAMKVLVNLRFDEEKAFYGSERRSNTSYGLELIGSVMASFSESQSEVTARKDKRQRIQSEVQTILSLYENAVYYDSEYKGEIKEKLSAWYFTLGEYQKLADLHKYYGFTNERKSDNELGDIVNQMIKEQEGIEVQRYLALDKIAKGDPKNLPDNATELERAFYTVVQKRKKKGSQSRKASTVELQMNRLKLSLVMTNNYEGYKELTNNQSQSAESEFYNGVFAYLKRDYLLAKDHFSNSLNSGGLLVNQYNLGLTLFKADDMSSFCEVFSELNQKYNWNETHYYLYKYCGATGLITSQAKNKDVMVSRGNRREVISQFDGYENIEIAPEKYPFRIYVKYPGTKLF